MLKNIHAKLVCKKAKVSCFQKHSKKLRHLCLHRVPDTSSGSRIAILREFFKY